MKVVVETRTGGRAGHRVWLSARQQLRVGCTEWAEFCVPDDRSMAEIQFALECGGRGCRLRNLSGDRPLYVNGLRVEQHTLVSGDLIRAGATEFLVSIQLGHTEVPETLPLASQASGAARRAAKYTAIGDGDLICLSGERAKCPEDEVAMLLNEEHGMYLLLHRELADGDDWAAALQDADANGPVPEQPENEAADDRSAQTRPHESSEFVLISPSTRLHRLEIIRRNWTRGALTVLYSGREEAGVRKLVAERPLLALHPADLAGRLLRWRTRIADSELSGLAALLLPMSETHWGIFASPRFRPVWERIGLDEPPQNHRASWDRFDTFWLSAESAAQAMGGISDGQTLAAG